MTAEAKPLNSVDDIAQEMTSLRRRSTTLLIARAVSYVAYAWVVISLIILAFGFVLQLFAANPDVQFTQWIYRHVADIMEPFRGIFPQAQFGAGATLDVSILFAMFVYSLIALAVRSLIDWLTYRRERVERRLLRDQARLEASRGRGPAETFGGRADSYRGPADSYR